MSINLIPNDPLAQSDAPMRVHSPRPEPPSNQAGFNYSNGANEARHAVGTPEFLFWQCTEGALAALEMWRTVDGPLRRWATRKKIDIRQNAGTDLNAFYDRNSVRFFEFTTGDKTTFSGASTDVVAHEVGHGLLDAIRPDLFNSFFTETGAAHEAFGDLVAIFTALEDVRQRRRLLELSPNLWSESFIEATAEDLADGARRELGASHPAAKPRHAFNFFDWALPTTLPSSAPPGRLSSEIHSFGRVFSGCVYDVLGNIYNSQPLDSQTALRKASRTTAKLLFSAIRNAPAAPRFFRAIGQEMIAVDQAENRGANVDAIRGAFAFHNITLATASDVAPMAALSAGAPSMAASAKTILSAGARRELKRRLGAGAGRIQVRHAQIGGQRVVYALHERQVPLAGVSSRLKGVKVAAPEPILLGAVNGRSAILGGMPDASVTHDEVESFVKTLVEHNCIDYGDKKKSGAKKTVPDTGQPPMTHQVKRVGRQKMLVRKRFSCPTGC